MPVCVRYYVDLQLTVHGREQYATKTYRCGGKAPRINLGKKIEADRSASHSR
jgi:hypothetical protein